MARGPLGCVSNGMCPARRRAHCQVDRFELPCPESQVSQFRYARSCPTGAAPTDSRRGGLIATARAVNGVRWHLLCHKRPSAGPCPADLFHPSRAGGNSNIIYTVIPPVSPNRPAVHQTNQHQGHEHVNCCVPAARPLEPPARGLTGQMSRFGFESETWAVQLWHCRPGDVRRRSAATCARPRGVQPVAAARLGVLAVIAAAILLLGRPSDGKDLPYSQLTNVVFGERMERPRGKGACCVLGVGRRSLVVVTLAFIAIMTVCAPIPISLAYLLAVLNV